VSAADGPPHGARRARGIPRLHVITDDRVLTSNDWPRAAQSVLEAGGERVALHVRGPGLQGRFLYERVAALIEPARRAGATVVVNDRVDIALTLPVAGVQLRESSLAVAATRRLIGWDKWIGASVHAGARAAEAASQGADYLLVGTLFATPSHPGRAGGGPELIAQVLATCELPLVAIGGITPERVGAAREAGAHGVAVLGGVWESSNPAGAVRDYLLALEKLIDVEDRCP
jgi:thiamine-phosphate pyrophosphorylase